jgi:hypothetical protein
MVQVCDFQSVKAQLLKRNGTFPLEMALKKHISFTQAICVLSGCIDPMHRLRTRAISYSALMKSKRSPYIQRPLCCAVYNYGPE